MARKRSSETEFAVSPNVVVPARRKTATATRTRKKLQAAPAEALSESAVAAPVEAQAVALEVVSVPEPTFEQISALAYSYWEARGYQGGSSEEDWLRAEHELRSRSFAATA